MLEVRVFGQFDVRLDGEPIELPSRPAQRLLAYLILSAGIAHPREKLAGLLRPDAEESNARRNLRIALWRLRKALEPGGTNHRGFLLSDDLSIAFDADSQYWLDAAVLDRKRDPAWSVDELIEVVSTYRGELLPGFYDEWAVRERDRLQALFEHRMQLLLEELVAEKRWREVLEWGQHWISFAHAPEPAYRALMVAHAALGDLSSVTAILQRCTEALQRELGVQPSEETLALHERLSQGEEPGAAPLLLAALPAPGPPPFKGLHYFDEGDAQLFFGRERLTARLLARLAEDRFLAVVGASGSGKSSLVRAGLVPRLKLGKPLSGGTVRHRDGASWSVRVITPTSHPSSPFSSQEG
ncbi:MAG TPA: BTAD domain-containing putative transcriptional regulator, partial [Ardenticatenaceae bacterium]|nr:BTAD domain-containing putative transcriptional regulator [Ardenticatenaceae bacterium]